jgi:hypothetical protein
MTSGSLDGAQRSSIENLLSEEEANTSPRDMGE